MECVPVLVDPPPWADPLLSSHLQSATWPSLHNPGPIEPGVQPAADDAFVHFEHSHISIPSSRHGRAHAAADGNRSPQAYGNDSQGFVAWSLSSNTSDSGAPSATGDDCTQKRIDQRPPSYRTLAATSATMLLSSCAEQLQAPNELFSNSFRDEQWKLEPIRRDANAYQAAREKNRVAAKRCRSKAKMLEVSLMEEEKRLISHGAALRIEEARLQAEILDLKHEIFRHANCDCSFIRNYITKAAHDYNKT